MMELKLFYIKPIKVKSSKGDQDIDIVVCALDKKEATATIKKYFPKQVSYYTDDEFLPPFVYEPLDTTEIFEVKSSDDLPDGWGYDIIPWGIPDDFPIVDCYCWQFLEFWKSQKEYEPLIGKKIKSIYNCYDSIHIELDNGSTIEFENDKYCEIKIKGSD